MNKKNFLILTSFCLIFLAWELFSHLFPHTRFVCPPPLLVLKATWQWKERLAFHTLATVKELFGGFLLATLWAFPLAYLMLRFKHARALLQPIFLVIQCLPMFALAPIMVLWFGWGYTAVLIPTALMIFFPFTLNIYQGLRSTPPSLIDFFRINGATRMQTLWKLQIPWALPHIFSGLRISSAIAGIGAVAGEWAGAQKGLGVLMLESRRCFDLEVTFAALFSLTLLTIFLYSVVLILEKICMHRGAFSFRVPFTLKAPMFAVKRRRVSFPLFCCTLLFLSITACVKTSSKSVRLLLDWLPNPNHIPLYVGIQKGFFEEQGIHLSVQKLLESGGVLSYLTSRQVDLALYHTPGVLQAFSKKAELKIIGSIVPVPLRAFIYRADLPIENPSDLTGKVMGYCIGMTTSFLDFLLEQGKIVPAKQKNVSVDLVSAMSTHQVDFIYGGFWNIEPFLLSSCGTQTKSIKIEELGVPCYEELIVIANDATKFSSPLFIQNFQIALDKSIAYCKAHPEEAFAIYSSFNPDKRPTTLQWEYQSWCQTCPLLSDTQKVSLEKLENFYFWQREHRLIGECEQLSTLLP